MLQKYTSESSNYQVSVAIFIIIIITFIFINCFLEHICIKFGGFFHPLECEANNRTHGLRILHTSTNIRKFVKVANIIITVDIWYDDSFFISYVVPIKAFE